MRFGYVMDFFLLELDWIFKKKLKTLHLQFLNDILFKNTKGVILSGLAGFNLFSAEVLIDYIMGK